MLRLSRLVAVGLSAVAVTGCASMNVSSHVERSIDFGQYRTYDWGPADALPTGDPRLDQNPFFKDHVVSDADVPALAAAQGRILVTHDFRTMPRYFAECLAAGRSSPGMFLTKQRTPVAAVIEDLVLIWTASQPEDWTNRIVEIPLR